MVLYMKGSKKQINKGKKTVKKSLKGKQKGGAVSFNSVLNLDDLNGNFDLYKDESTNPQDPAFVLDARLGESMVGGKKQKKTKQNRRKKRNTYKKRNMKKQKGGSLNPLSYSFVTGNSTSNTSLPIAFGTTGGTEFMEKTLMSKPIPSTQMTIDSTMPTVV